MAGFNCDSLKQVAWSMATGSVWGAWVGILLAWCRAWALGSIYYPGYDSTWTDRSLRFLVLPRLAPAMCVAGLLPSSVAYGRQDGVWQGEEAVLARPIEMISVATSQAS